MTDKSPKTVGELVAELQKLPPELMIVTSGYEGGYITLSSPVTIRLALNVHKEWYYGPHEQVQDYNSDEFDGKTIVDAVLI